MTKRRLNQAKITISLILNNIKSPELYDLRLSSTYFLVTFITKNI